MRSFTVSVWCIWIVACVAAHLPASGAGPAEFEGIAQRYHDEGSLALASDAWQQAACLLLGECGRGAHESQEAANTPLTLHDRQRAATWLLKASHYYGMTGAYDRVVDLLEQSIMAWPFDPDVHRQYGTVRMSVTLTARGRGCGRAGAAQNTSQGMLRGSGAGMGSGLPWWGPLDAMGVGAHTWSHMPWEVSVADVFQRAQYLDLALIAARGAPTQCAVQRAVPNWCEERGVTVRVVNSTQPALAKARCRVLSHSSHGIPGRWSDCDDTFHARHSLVAEFEHVFLSGMEPVVWDECRVFLHVHGPLVSLRAGGLAFTDMPPRVNTFDGQPLVVTQVDLVVSVLQMRYLSYYHWMVECLSRLVLLKPTLAAHPNAVLLVPAEASGLVEQSLSMLGIVPARAEDPPGSRLPTEPSAAVFDELRVRTLWTGPLRVVSAKRLITADWRVAVGGDYGDSEGGRFLPPVSTLQLLQQALQVDLPAARPARTVVWVSRNPPDGGPLGMRAVTNELEVLDRLRAAVPPPFSVQVHRGSHTMLARTRGMFRDAAVVVGVHGGGLANMLFCQPRSVVIELAMPEPMYVMYRYLAAALGHEMYQIRLPPNTFHGPVHIGEGVMDALERAVTHALQ